MKKPALTLLLLIVGSAVLGQIEIPDAPRWQVTLRVVGEDGGPVPDASVSASYYIPPPPDATEAGSQKAGTTDTNGLATLTARSGPRIGCAAGKDGYYTTSGLTIAFKERLDGKWQPWNPTGTLVLRKIGSPIPMYAKAEETKVPKENEPIGFDLMAGDWVAPYGKGKGADMLFTVRRKIISDREYDAELKLTFPNAGDGIAAAPPEANTGSAFRTARTAAENSYEPGRVWHYSNLEQPKSVFGYFFRVRTVPDESGKIKTALYGKIRGDFRFYAGTRAPQAGMGFDYYLNPKPNDRNVEFDPKRNLLSGQNVTAP